MADTIDIAGKPVKKSVLAGLALGVVVLGGVVYFRNKNNAAASAATPITDPATGFQQGSPEDLAALSQLQASYQGAGLGGGGGGGSVSTPPIPQGFTSNAEWAQAAEDYIVNTAGGSASVVGNALGKYLTGQGMTPDQMNVANQAIAFEGYPPVPGPNGFPPAMRELPVPPPPKPPPPGPGTVTVPDVRGMGYGHAHNVCTSAGLKVTNTGRINSSWEVTKQSLTPGAKVKKGTGIRLTVVNHPAVR